MLTKFLIPLIWRSWGALKVLGWEIYFDIQLLPLGIYLCISTNFDVQRVDKMAKPEQQMMIRGLKDESLDYPSW